MATFGWIIAVGIWATAVMDLWSQFQRKMLGMAVLDYALVGRWLAHMPHGRFRHASIVTAPPVPGERVLGWAAHYAIGIVFAALLLALAGPAWARAPSPAPALGFGAATVIVPFAVMQPAFGFGVAASRLPKPWAARAKSLLTHLVFGAGLYLAATALALLD